MTPPPTSHHAGSPAESSRRDSFRRWVKSAGPFYVGSILLHTVAAIALLSSWNFGQAAPASAKQPAVVAKVASIKPQIVHLELGMATVRVGDMTIENLIKQKPSAQSPSQVDGPQPLNTESNSQALPSKSEPNSGTSASDQSLAIPEVQ